MIVSRSVMAVLYHMHILRALDGFLYVICMSSRPLMDALYHMRVFGALDGCSI